MDRRSVLTALATVPASGMAAGLYAWQIEPYWVEYVNLPLPIKNLPLNLEGSLLVQMSDIHVGNRFDWSYMIHAFQTVSELQPAIVVYTGDYVSYEGPEQLRQLRQVFQHAPLGSLGSLAILGNHDYGRGWSQPEVAEDITSILTDTGIQVLRNQIENVEGLNIAGLDDLWGMNYEPEPITAKLMSDEANLVLSHNPDTADEPIWNGYHGWILSGHTHGGQVKPPFLEPPVLPVRNKRYTSGIIDLDEGRMLYINRALGNLWPIRLNMRPEVTMFTLARAKPEPSLG